MSRQNTSRRGEYRLREGIRANASPTLSQRFPELQSLTVEFSYFSPEGTPRSSPVRYEVNLARARSVFRLDCLNSECVAGDYDLSTAIAIAVLQRLPTAEGEISCVGWLSKLTIDRLHCGNALRYTLSLEYGTHPRVDAILQAPETGTSHSRSTLENPGKLK